MGKHVKEQTISQILHPWKTVVRTVFQLVLALAIGAPIIYTAITNGGDPAQAAGGAAVVITVAGAITRLMNTPWAQDFLERFLPFLAAEDKKDNALNTEEE